MTFQYDRDVDILYINTCEPYPEQESEELDDEIIARFNPDTGEVENLEVLFSLRVCYGKNSFNCQSLRVYNYPQLKPFCNPPKQTIRACHFQKQPL